MFDWHVQTDRPPGFAGVRIYIWRKLPNGDREFMVEGGKIAKTFKDEVALKTPSEVTFATLDDDQVADQLLAALQKGGFTLPKADHTAGKLEATERHLEDMRKLVFKDKA